MSRTPYVSIDLETTGLEPEWCQILEIGAVIDDWVSPVEELKQFHCYVVHERIQGQPYALWLNAAILKRIAERDKPENRVYTFLTPDKVASWFCAWLLQNGFDDPTKRAFTPAGKNFAGFDRPFLKELPGFGPIKMHHRCADPGSMFWNPDTDDVLPDSKQCMQRSGQEGSVAHTAIEDAISVINMVRFATDFKQMLGDMSVLGLEEFVSKVPADDPTGPVANAFLAYIKAHNGEPINKPSEAKAAALELSQQFYQRRFNTVQQS